MSGRPSSYRARQGPTATGRGVPLVAAAALVIASAIGGCDAPSDDPGSSRGPFHFVDVTRRAGVQAPIFSGGLDKRYIIEAKGGSAGALFDSDGDGDLDLYVVNGSQLDAPADATPRTNLLYRNELTDRGDAGFTDVTAATGAGDEGWGMGVTTADYDNDGDQDIHVTNFGPNSLYRREHDGTYTEIAAAAGVADSAWSTGCSFADFDNDGDLDLFVSNYVDFLPVLGWPEHELTTTWRGVEVFAGPAGLDGVPNALYRNRGDGRFDDVTEAAGMAAAAPGPSLGAVWGDFDGDGDPDLYVANDSVPNYLYRNDGDGAFTEVAAAAGVSADRDGRSQAGMGCVSEDYDNDGWLDLFVTNFSSDSSTLYRHSGAVSTGALHFTDVSYRVGIGEATWPTLGWGAGLVDFDNDGDKDLFIANGHVYPNVEGAGVEEDYAQRNQLFEGRAGRYVEVTASAGPGLRVRKTSRGVSFGDYDNDGDMDVFVADLDDEPTLLRNDSPASGHWLMVKTVGVASNRDGIGARIIVTAGSSMQMREIRAGDGFLTRSDARAHFGLGRHRRVERVEVRWPSGQVDRLVDVDADRIVVVVEGRGAKPMAGRAR